MLSNLVDAFGARFSVYMSQGAEAEDSFLVYVSASEEGIISFCLQYGEHCQLLDAPQVEEKICAKLDAILEKYSKAFFTHPQSKLFGTVQSYLDILRKYKIVPILMGIKFTEAMA
ncbi:MAG: hypothetical protein LIP12_06765 [Clostridiales bacterium]|nr:hypothetical protein [Clostridiales bacterium]